MPYDYVYEAVDYGDYGYTHSPIYVYTPADYYPPMLTGFPWVMANIEMIVLYPAAMILNLLLFIAIMKSKIQSEPWRWLIAHTSFTIFIMTIFVFLARVTRIYHVPSLHSSPLCPFVSVLMPILDSIIMISFVLVAIERFRALKLAKENEGGMGKKAVVLSLCLFWLLVVLLIIIPLTVEPIISGRSRFAYYLMTADIEICQVQHLMVYTLAKMVFALWALITLLTVIIGTIVLACRKTTTPEMKASIVAPTLAFTIIFFFLAMGPEVLYSVMYPMMADLIIKYFSDFNVLYVFIVTSWISFPIVWLVTWSRNGDICWKKLSPCCHRDEDEKRHLLEP